MDDAEFLRKKREELVATMSNGNERLNELLDNLDTNGSFLREQVARLYDGDDPESGVRYIERLVEEMAEAVSTYTGNAAAGYTEGFEDGREEGRVEAEDEAGGVNHSRNKSFVGGIFSEVDE